MNNEAQLRSDEAQFTESVEGGVKTKKWHEDTFLGRILLPRGGLINYFRKTPRIWATIFAKWAFGPLFFFKTNIHWVTLTAAGTAFPFHTFPRRSVRFLRSLVCTRRSVKGGYRG